MSSSARARSRRWARSVLDQDAPRRPGWICHLIKCFRMTFSREAASYFWLLPMSSTSSATCCRSTSDTRPCRINSAVRSVHSRKSRAYRSAWAGRSVIGGFPRLATVLVYAGLGSHVANRNLELNFQEKKDLVEFLRGLSGEGSRSRSRRCFRSSNSAQLLRAPCV